MARTTVRAASSLAAVERDDVAAVFVAQAEGALGDRGAQAEAARLGDRPLGQLGAGDAGREAEVVLDREEMLAWPPRAVESIMNVERPSVAA